MTAAGAPEGGRPTISSVRLMVTLGVAGALAGSLIVFVFRATEPTILAYKAEVLRLAVQEVLHEPDRYDTLYVHDGVLTAELPEGVDAAVLDQVYVGYSGAEPVGVALVGAQPGFQDVIRLIFGFEPGTGALLGMKVLESKETPGLGDKIEKDSTFVAQFGAVIAPLEGVKPGSGSGAPGEVDMITGATISSRTVIRIINETIEQIRPLLVQYGAVR